MDLLEVFQPPDGVAAFEQAEREQAHVLGGPAVRRLEDLEHFQSAAHAGRSYGR